MKPSPRRLLPLIILTLVLIVFAVGCSDDDDDPSTSSGQANDDDDNDDSAADDDNDTGDDDSDDDTGDDDTGDDDNDDDNNDDDTGDDDTGDDDNDDDTGDDDTFTGTPLPWMELSAGEQYVDGDLVIDLITGGGPGQHGLDLAFTPDGRPVVAVSNMGWLTLYEQTPNGDITETFVRTMAIDPKLEIDPSGVFHLAFLEFSKYLYEGRLTYGTNAGGTWVYEELPIQNVMMSEWDFAVDASGKVHFTWGESASDNPNHEPCDVVYVSNASGAWQRSVVSTEICWLDWEFEIGISPTGVVHLVHPACPSIEVETYVAVDRGGPAEWIRESIGEFFYYHLGLDVAFGPDGEPRVGIYQDSAWTLYLATRDAGDWSLELAASATPTSHSMRLAVAPDGTPYFSYPETREDAWIVAKIDGTWRTQMVANYYKPIGSTDLGIAPDGKAVFVYYYLDEPLANVDPFSLWMAVGNLDDWSYVLVDRGEQIYNPSLALADDGTAQIAFSTEAGLMVATNATGNWRGQLVDASYWNGSPIDSVLSADGLLHLVYRDWDNDRIRYAVGRDGEWMVETIVDGVEHTALAVALGPAGQLHVMIGLDDGLTYYRKREGQWVAQDVGTICYDVDIEVDDQAQPHVAAKCEQPFGFHYFTKTKRGWTRELLMAPTWRDPLVTQIKLLNGRPVVTTLTTNPDWWTVYWIQYFEKIDGNWEQVVVDRYSQQSFDLGEQWLTIGPDDTPNIVYSSYGSINYMDSGTSFAQRPGVGWQYTGLPFPMLSGAAIVLDGNGATHLTGEAGSALWYVRARPFGEK